MTRKLFALLLAVLTALSLFGCTGDTPAPTDAATVPASTVKATDATEPTVPPTVATEPPTTQPPVETVPPTTEASRVPYLQKVPNPNYPIFKEPDYVSQQTGTVKVAGTYTIIEEAQDKDGKTWGRLKSGAGWICVTDIDPNYVAAPLITVDYADDYLVSHGSYESCVAATDEYAFPFVFRFGQNVKNVRFCSAELVDVGMRPGTLLGSWGSLSADVPLVVWGSFPGDMSAYYISFEDGAGTAYGYFITISGLDGSMQLSVK